MTVVGMMIFPKLTQLDLTGPFEVLSRMPDTRVLLVGAGPVTSETGLRLTPDASPADAPQVDILFVPGGPGVNAAMEDEATLLFLRRQGEKAAHVTSVCTGALVLGAAGLLRGYRATTHWLSLDLLAAFGAQPVRERVVVDRNRITGGGVTAGIDFALQLAAHLHGQRVAEEIQLVIEYDPAPPFHAGSPKVAPPALVESVSAARRAIQEERRRIVARAAARLDSVDAQGSL
jgi:cyclohexyl-isocyanide hydratase